MFQSDGESSMEPLVKGAGLQLPLFPQISLHPGLAFNPSTPWAGRLAPSPRFSGITELSAWLGLFIEFKHKQE